MTAKNCVTRFCMILSPILGQIKAYICLPLFALFRNESFNLSTVLAGV